MAREKAAELQTACAFNICLKCKVVRDDEWQRQSCLLIMYGKKTQNSISIKRAPLEKGTLDSISHKSGEGGQSWNKTPNVSQQRKH